MTREDILDAAAQVIRGVTSGVFRCPDPGLTVCGLLCGHGGAVESLRGRIGASRSARHPGKKRRGRCGRAV
jgi:hypothetical protein